MIGQLRIIQDGFHHAPLNMARDEVLFRRVKKEVQKYPVFRLYGFRTPAVTVGVCQKLKNDNALMKYYEQHMNMTRRITGGGAVFHGDDLTYSLVAHESFHPHFKTIEQSYEIIHYAIGDAITKAGGSVHYYDTDKKIFMGTRNCFTTPVKNDVMFDTVKIAGAAQKRSHGFLLHQGSIVLKPLLNSGGHFNDIFEKISTILIENFSHVFNVETRDVPFTTEECQEAYQLMDNKYTLPEWIFKN